MFWMLLAIVLLFVILGIAFSLGRGENLLAGYNTMSKDQKARYDARALCRFMCWQLRLRQHMKNARR